MNSYEISGTYAEKADVLSQCLAQLIGDLNRVKPSCSILVTGSSNYGVSDSLESCTDSNGYDDIDLIAVTPDSISFNVVQKNLSGILDHSKWPGDTELQMVAREEVDIVRAEGSYRGIPIGIHMLSKDKLQQFCHPVGRKKFVQKLVPNHDKYKKKIFRDRVLGSGRLIEKLASFSERNGFIVLDSHFHDSIEQDGLPTEYSLGVDGDKILAGQVIYENPLVPIQRTIVNYWQSFIRTNLLANTDMTNDQIVDLFIRGHRFSAEYRANMHKRIDDERELLQRRMSKLTDL